jgi:type VI protein secretion system component Hcp
VESFSLSGKIGSETPGVFGIYKRLDRASAPLFMACAQGTIYANARIDLKLSTAGSESNICRVELEQTAVTSQSAVENSGDALPLELIGLSFRKITYTYFYTQKGAQKQQFATFDYDTQTGSSTDVDGSEPPDPDKDGDGMLDAWESAHGLNPATNDAQNDPDGDGLKNIDEFQLGTDPQSATSFFRAILAPNEASPGNFRVTWNSVAGKTYIVEWTADFSVPFTTVGTVTPTTTSGSFDVTANGANGFYRVRPQ